MTGAAVALTGAEQALLDGAGGPARQAAMAIVVQAAAILDAPRLVEIGWVHVDACHYAGRVHVDFARWLVDRGARFEIPAWTNTVPVSLVQPDPRTPGPHAPGLRDGAADPATALFLAEARMVTGLYTALGCRPVWTCAPYQLDGGPGFGDQIVVGESNAVSFYNSVVGARTNKYGDFLDVCCGLVGRAPAAGLHTDAGRRATLAIDLAAIPEPLRGTELFCHVLGHLVGREAGTDVPVILGLPPDGIDADGMKAICAAAAASGGVAMLHAVGITPEAPTLAAATGGIAPARTVAVTPAQLVAARDSLSIADAAAGPDGPVSMVALGTPHFSRTEFRRLARLIAGRPVADGVRLYVSTSRIVAEAARADGSLAAIEAASGTVLVDTCTYFAPAVQGCRGRVMTNAAKWAYYAPGLLSVDVAFGSLADCVETAVTGRVRRDPALWSDRAWGLA